MDKIRIQNQRHIYKINNFSLYEGFQVAWDDIYTIRLSEVSITTQAKFRANNLAFHLTALWLDLAELQDRISSS